MVIDLLAGEPGLCAAAALFLLAHAPPHRSAATGRPDLQRLDFQQVPGGPESFTKYPFPKGAFPLTTTKISMVEIADIHIRDVFLVYADGPRFMRHLLRAWRLLEDQDRIHLNFNALARTPVYLQTCPDETSIISSGGSTGHGDNMRISLSYVTQWVYTGNAFKYRATYQGAGGCPGLLKATPGINAPDQSQDFC